MMVRFESDVVGPPPPMVRDEQVGDRESVDALLRSTFPRQEDREALEDLWAAQVPGSRGLVAVRTQRSPGADMSAVGDGELLGCLRLTPASVDAQPVLVLAPLAVGSASRHRGVGTYLVQFAVEMVADQGCAAVVTPYDQPFLDQFGFGPAEQSGVAVAGGDPLRVAPLRPTALAGELTAPEALTLLLSARRRTR